MLEAASVWEAPSQGHTLKLRHSLNAWRPTWLQLIIAEYRRIGVWLESTSLNRYMTDIGFSMDRAHRLTNGRKACDR
jgi:hypothetical protein